MNPPDRKTVLLVDDDPLLRRAIRRHVERWGYLVLEVGTYAGAETVLGAVKVDAIVTDLDLGGGPTGFDVRSLAVEKEIPCILVTGDPTICGSLVFPKPIDFVLLENWLFEVTR